MTWSLLYQDKEPVWGTAFVEGNGSTPSRLSYVAKSLKASQDKFWLKVSDGVGSDTFLLGQLLHGELDCLLSVNLLIFQLKRCRVSLKISVFPNNSLDEITFHLKRDPRGLLLIKFQKKK